VSGTSINDRFLLSAVVDRLVFGDSLTFNINDAHELERLLPTLLKAGILSRILPQITARGRFAGKSAIGLAAGVGNLSIKGSDFEFDLDSRGRSVLRVGQWKLCRVGSAIEIEQVMADDGDEAKTARLEFRGLTPIRMSLLTSAEVHLGPLKLVKAQFRPWKLPHDSASDVST
jgi:hypothetical protein